MSGNDDWQDNFANDNDRDELFDPNPPPKPGMSTGVKIILAVGVLGAVMVLLCCGGLFLVGRNFQQGLTEDPAEIRARAKEIANIDVPEEYEPEMGADVGAFGVNAMRMLMFNAPGNAGILMLMEMPVPFEEGNNQQQVDQALEQQMGEKAHFKESQTEMREFTIRGKKCPFHFLVGIEANTDRKLHQVSGAFPGKEGKHTVVLFLQIDDDNYDEEQVVKMIESIE